MENRFVWWKFTRAAILRLDVGGNLPVRCQQKSILTEGRKTNSAKIEILRNSF
jgi:hypothetical protein